MPQPIAIEGVTGLAVAPGALLRVSGAVTTSIDGSVFDAVSSWTPSGAGAMPGGLFDPAAGGLRVVEAYPAEHAYVLAVDGASGPVCTAAGVASPCLVSRLAALSHARLKTVREFAATLSGSVSVADQAGPPASPGLGERVERAAGWLVIGLLVLAVVAYVARRRARTPLGRVRTEARRALRATRSDPTLQGVRSQIAAMVARAVALDGARRLERDCAASLAGIERIEAALRWVTLRACATRSPRDEAAREAAVDPVESLATELALREQAIAEVNAALSER